MSKIDELTSDEIAAARQDYLWDRRYDARQGIKDALTTAISSNIRRQSGRIDTFQATLAMEAILAAVAPERRCLIIGTLIELYERWYAVRDDKAASTPAYRPISSLLADAASAQISGIVSLFGGAR